MSAAHAAGGAALSATPTVIRPSSKAARSPAVSDLSRIRRRAVCTLIPVCAAISLTVAASSALVSAWRIASMA
jgi:hypothetical protein